MEEWNEIDNYSSCTDLSEISSLSNIILSDSDSDLEVGIAKNLIYIAVAYGDKEFENK